MKFSIIMPYYRDPALLKKQLATFDKYPVELTDDIELIIVDDGSPEPDRAVHIIRKHYDGSFVPEWIQLFHIIPDLAWNVEGAINVGAEYAVMPWMLILPADHILNAEGADLLLSDERDENEVIYFDRMRPDGKRYDCAQGIMMMSRMVFVQMGMYDERYCGVYGLSGGDFQRRLSQHRTHDGGLKLARIVHPHVKLKMLHRPHTEDCGQHSLMRKGSRDGNELSMMKLFYESSIYGNTLKRFRLPHVVVDL